MTLGVICRQDQSGLGIQSRLMVDLLQPDRVVAVDMGRDNRGQTVAIDHPNVLCAQWNDPRRPTVGMEVARFLKGCTTVYAPESLYWTPLPRRLARARFALHCNPELWKPTRERNVIPAWPTVWCADRHPYPVIPHPSPVGQPRFDALAADNLARSGPARTVLHMAAPAMLDRNGSVPMRDALHLYRGPPFTLLVGGSRFAGNPQAVRRGKDSSLRWPDRIGDVRVKVLPAVEDHVDLYRNVDLMVIPRRYAGLCLERGSVVQTSVGLVPIEDVAPGARVRDDQGWTQVRATSERVVPEVVKVRTRGAALVSSPDHLHLVADSAEGALNETKAEHVRVGQWLHVPAPHGSRSRAVDVGPKPVRKGLRFWHETMELDANWCRLIGLWLAEGWSGLYAAKGRGTPTPTICWAICPDHRFLAEEIVATLALHGVHATIKKQVTPDAAYGEGSVWLVRCRNLWLYTFLEELGMGHGAWNKRAPDVDADLVPSLVGGWLDGDGSCHAGNVAGFSRSTAMIADMWRLCLKAGVMGSVTKEGQQLNFGDDLQSNQVAGWCHRVAMDRVRESQRRDLNWRIDPSGGWRVRVTAAGAEEQETAVVALETVSGKYVANGLLTHNCLPASEAAAAGIPVLMTDLSPQDGWSGVDSSIACGRGTVHAMRGGRFNVAEPDPQAIADALMRYTSDAGEHRRAWQQEACQWAVAHDWAHVKDRWVDWLGT